MKTRTTIIAMLMVASVAILASGTATATATQCGAGATYDPDKTEVAVGFEGWEVDYTVRQGLRVTTDSSCLPPIVDTRIAIVS